MTLRLLQGQIAVEADRDEEGHRTYNITQLVESSDGTDGPSSIWAFAGLPAVGSTYLLTSPYAGEQDLWAFCYPTRGIRAHEGDQGRVTVWSVTSTFSTKPLKRCQSTTIEDPLLEPPKVSGSFSQQNRELLLDRHGNPLRYSSHEPIKGQAAEFNYSQPNVHIEFNTSTLQLALYSEYMNCLNDAPLWGLSARMIRLAGLTWARELYGICNYYYKISLDFEINFETWDKLIPDEGTKVLKGRWKKLPKPPTGANVAITSGSVPNAIAGSAYTTTLTAAGGTTPYIWTVSGLPAGLSFNSSTGIISGTPTVDGVYPITVSIIDSTLPVQTTASTTFELIVSPVGSSSVQNTSDPSYGWELELINGRLPDPNNPSHFVRYKDRNGENTRVRLNGAGLPAETSIIVPGIGQVVPTFNNSVFQSTAGNVKVEGYREKDFLQLGSIPTSF